MGSTLHSRSTGTKVFAGLGLALALMSAIGLVSYRSAAELESTLHWEIHTHKVLNELHDVLFQLQTAEIGQLGFMVSGSQHDLAAYRAAREAIHAELKTLRELTADNPAQQQRLDALEPLIAAAFVQLSRMIESRQRSGPTALPPGHPLAAGVEGELMDSIRLLIRAMEDEEDRLLEERSVRAEASARRAQAIITASSFLALGFMSFAGYTVRRDLLRRRLAEEALERALGDLERRVEERTARLSEANAELLTEIAERERAEAELKKSHDDLLSILDRLRSGTAMTDQTGRVTFLSRVAQELCGSADAEAVGMSWQELPLFAGEGRASLEAMARLPADSRSKVPIQLETPGGRHYWMDVEIQDDPRDPQRKMFFVYDVSEVYDLRRLLDEKGRFHGLVGKAAVMQSVYRRIQEVAAVDSTVLIEGETGTGKELVARAIHHASPRRSAPFIAVNCAGLTESLLASQLFGHRKGAFTGAIADHRGLFESADGGTILLDEIGDIPLSVQTSLLRVLQEREITRVGESRPRKIDVRVIAATHHDLGQDMADKAFRSDLFYRIRVARIAVPPLRERREDIPLLVARFLGEFRTATGKAVHDISDEAMRVLIRQPWPGNVRELRSTIEFALIGCRAGVLQVEDLPPDLTHGEGEGLPGCALRDPDEGERYRAALRLAAGNRTAAARLLGVSRATFYRHLAHLQPLADTGQSRDGV